MQKLSLVACGFVLGAAVAMTGGAAMLRGVEHAAQPEPPDMQAMMQKWLETVKPGPAHAALETTVGNWETITKIWMAGPDAPPTSLAGTSKRSWVLGKRFVLEESKGQFPMPDSTGQMSMVAHDGIGLTGYDNFRNVYVGCWADTLGTQLLTMTGTPGADGTSFTSYGPMDEPMLNVIGRTVKYKLSVVDPDTMVFEIFDLHAGEDYRVVEVTYKRAK